MTLAIVLNGEPLSTFSSEKLKSFDRIMAVDGGANHLFKLGLSFHYWIGDDDSRDSDHPWPAECKKKFLKTDKDDSDGEASIHWAISQGYDQLTLFGGGGGRLDHWVSNLHMVAQYKEIIGWCTERERCWAISQNTQFPVTPGIVVSIIPLGQGPWHISSEGLEWPLELVDFSRKISLSNRTIGQTLVLSPQSGRFLIIFPREERFEHPKAE